MVTGQLADYQLADWTTRGCHRRLCVLSFPFWRHLRDRELSSYRPNAPIAGDANGGATPPGVWPFRMNNSPTAYTKLISVFAPLCENMTSSSYHNNGSMYITYCTVVRGGPSHGHSSQVTCTENFAKFGCVVLSYVSGQTDSQTRRSS